MPYLQIMHPDGRQERILLSRATPVSIGSQTFNDVCIPGDQVAAMHCRIGWNKTKYEVTAATSRGVDVNTVIKQHSFLSSGDILRIGQCDVSYLEEESPNASSIAPEHQTVASSEASIEKKHRDKPKRSKEPPPLKKQGPSDRGTENAEIGETKEHAAQIVGGEPAQDAFKSTVVRKSVIARELQGARRRPGEQEILKSPFILILGAGSLILLLVAGTLYLLLGRETSAKLFAQAEQDLSHAKYSQAIELFEEYQRRYPESARIPKAKALAAKARIQKEISGALPAWASAEQRLQQFIREFRNTDQFSELQPAIRAFSEEIALGAANAAALRKDRTLLDVSRTAAQALERSAGDDDQLKASLERIRVATSKAVAAIARQDIRGAAVEKMIAALKEQRPIEALAERASLLSQLPEFAGDKEIGKILQEALQLEIDSIRVETLEQAALPDISETELHSVLPLYHARSSTAEQNSGQHVWVLAQDSCYAVDAVTGEVIWRRAIGGPSAFPPVTTRGAVPGWLVFDRRSSQLWHCRQSDGAFLWKQQLSGIPQGPPLLDDGQIYLLTDHQELLRLDEETGELTARVTLTQPVMGSPVLDQAGEVLFFAGDRGLIYSIQKRPLAPLTVTFTDHASGSMSVPLTTLGRLLLQAENDRANSARLRLWNASRPKEPMSVVHDLRADGQVSDAPVLRGSHLVLPLLGERISAYLVNDTAGRSEMTLIGTYRIQDGYRGPLHIALGPDQQFWMSSTAFRRFEIGTESIKLDSIAVAMGLTTQPLQALGETFFVARRALFAEGVQFTNIDRQSLSGNWRTVIGSRPVAASASADGGLALVTESGFVISIGPDQLEQGGIRKDVMTDLEWPVTLAKPPLSRRLDDGRLLLATGGGKPQLWIVDANRKILPPRPLPAGLEQAPVAVGPVLVLPLPGRIKIIRDGVEFEDWRAPLTGGQSQAWSHLLVTGDDEFLSFDENGVCRRMQIRDGDRPHVAEITSLKLPSPIPLPPLCLGDSIVIASHDGALKLLNARTLEQMANVTFPRSIVGMIAIGNHLVVWDSESLHCLDGERKLEEIWTSPLTTSRPVGNAIERDGKVWLACQRGEVLIINIESGEQRLMANLQRDLALGMLSIGQQLWVVACDGTLYRMPEMGDSTP